MVLQRDEGVRMPEEAADRKIKKLLQHSAIMIMAWVPADKRNQYLNYFYSLFTDES